MADVGAPTIVAAAFLTEDAAVTAARALRDRGRTIFAVTSSPSAALEDALGASTPRLVARACFAGGAAGAAAAYALQWWINVVDRPLDVGGRPLHAAPAFAILTWVTLVLLAALAAFAAFLFGAKLPRFTGPVADLRLLCAGGSAWVLAVEAPGAIADVVRGELAALGGEDAR